jgi:hypothetical protein
VINDNADGSTSPLPIVNATAAPDSPPRRLKPPASTTAARGDRTRDPTEVAMAFSASVNAPTKA